MNAAPECIYTVALLFYFSKGSEYFFHCWFWDTSILPPFLANCNFYQLTFLREKLYFYHHIYLTAAPYSDFTDLPKFVSFSAMFQLDVIMHFKHNWKRFRQFCKHFFLPFPAFSTSLPAMLIISTVPPSLTVLTLQKSPKLEIKSKNVLCILILECILLQILVYFWVKSECRTFYLYFNIFTLWYYYIAATCYFTSWTLLPQLLSIISVKKSDQERSQGWSDGWHWWIGGTISLLAFFFCYVDHRFFSGDLAFDRQTNKKSNRLFLFSHSFAYLSLVFNWMRCIFLLLQFLTALKMFEHPSTNHWATK